jgi:hypothetical protein
MASASNDGLARWTPVRILLARFRHNTWPPTPVNGTIHPSTTGQPTIGGIHNGIGLLASNVAGNQL